MKSGRFHLKSVRNPPDFMKSVRNPPDFMNVSFCVMIKYRSFFRKTNQISSREIFAVTTATKHDDIHRLNFVFVPSEPDKKSTEVCYLV